MAYTIVLTKDAVIKRANGIYLINLNAVVSDGAEIVMDIDISGKYNSNAPDLEATKAEIQKQFKVHWDKYIAENGVHDSTALDNAITALQVQAQIYVNQ